MPTRRALLALPLVLGAACSAPALAVGRLVDVEIVDRTRREAAPPAADGAAGAESSGRLGSALTNSADASAAPALPSAKAEQRLGTGHGEREYSPVSPVAFERASRDPAEVVRVRYDSEPNLVAMGVIGRWRAPWSPDPFPQYVPDPR
jgi:hypothetical protein